MHNIVNPIQNALFTLCRWFSFVRIFYHRLSIYVTNARRHSYGLSIVSIHALVFVDYDAIFSILISYIFIRSNPLARAIYCVHQIYISYCSIHIALGVRLCK